MSITPAVAAIGRLGFTGNVTPKIWYKQISLPSGRPDHKAITLLSEILYWYRPTEIRDEHTGQVVGQRKKFSDDKLQRSYQSFADDFGMTKREVQDSLKRLRDAGLITLELRSKTIGGNYYSNLLFIEPVAIEIDRITFPNVGEGITPNCNTSSENSEEVPRENVGGVTSKRGTYTEITQETSQRSNLDILSDSDSADVTPHPQPEPNPKPKSNRASGVPEDFLVDQRMLDWLTENQITTDWRTETSNFLDHHRAKGSKMVDWVASWRTWMRNSMKFARPAAQVPAPPTAKVQVSDSLSNIHDTDW
ncbi:hypothetical protein ACPUEK_15995 [Marinomonas gallaica]|uniref:hypothetical protein n=1 Tax=Marinomonas gallaica TaxID=1806667 RepID=UPI003CE48A6F